MGMMAASVPVLDCHCSVQQDLLPDFTRPMTRHNTFQKAIEERQWTHLYSADNWKGVIKVLDHPRNWHVNAFHEHSSKCRNYLCIDVFQKIKTQYSSTMLREGKIYFLGGDGPK